MTTISPDPREDLIRLIRRARTTVDPLPDVSRYQLQVSKWLQRGTGLLIDLRSGDNSHWGRMGSDTSVSSDWMLVIHPDDLAEARSGGMTEADIMQGLVLLAAKAR